MTPPIIAACENESIRMPKLKSEENIWISVSYIQTTPKSGAIWEIVNGNIKKHISSSINAIKLIPKT